MELLVDFALQERYKYVENLSDRLREFALIIDWELLWKIYMEIYTNTTSQRGQRTGVKNVLLVKMLALQSMYGLSDPELGQQVNNKIPFLKFLGFHKKIPYRFTVCYFREKLVKTGKDKTT